MKAGGTRGGLRKLRKWKNNRGFAIANIVFVFVFLNIWDFMTSGIIFNAMPVGAALFIPIAFLWYLDKFRATMLLTLISIFEFMLMFVFVWEGFELSGVAYSAKSIFWLPFLLAAGINGFLGLNVYAKVKKKSLLV